MNVDPVTDHLKRLISEGLIGVAETARMMGTLRRGRPCHPSTIIRWIADGIKLPDGGRLRLESIRVGDRVMTSEAALLRFLAAQQDPASVPVAAGPRSPAERHHANAKAEADLAELGIS